MATPDSQARGPAGLTASDPFVSAHTRALIVLGLFGVYIVVTVLAVANKIAQLTLPPLVIAAAEEDQTQLTLGDLLQFFIALATLFVFVALVVAFLVWLHRAAKNLPALGNAKSRIEFTPGWAVGWFFIPFANLVMPYKAVSEVWEKSNPLIPDSEGLMFAPRDRSPLLLGWWIAWVASNVLSNISWRLESNVKGAETFVTGFDIVSDVANIVAAALAIMVVRSIDRRQTERARYVTYVPHMPPPPPLYRQTPPQGHDPRDASTGYTPQTFGQN